MPFRLRVFFSIFLALFAVLLIGPLLIPVRPLEDTVPAHQLADPDSRFIDLGGIEVHYKTGALPGPADGPALVLLHGFGSSLFTWHRVLDPLGALGSAVAFDRPGFGLTERPLPGSWQGSSPYGPDGQARLTLALMDALGIDQAVLVGNSAGGALALKLALEHPDRVAGLVLIDAAVYREGGPAPWTRPLLFTPQLSRVGPLLMRQFAGPSGLGFLQAAWSNPERIDDATYEAYRKPLKVDNWDRALWEYTKAAVRFGVASELERVGQPALVITGADDKIVPPEESERLARELPDATLAVFDNCGHLPQEECPEPLLEVIGGWLADVGLIAAEAP